jgi:hypothetical protein
MESKTITIKMNVNNDVRYFRQQLPSGQNYPKPLTSSERVGTFNAASKAYSTYNDVDLLNQVVNAVSTAKKRSGLPMPVGPLTSIPGIFSMDLVMDRDGRIGWAFSGVLFDKIEAILIGTRRFYFKGTYYPVSGPIAM